MGGGPSPRGPSYRHSLPNTSTCLSNGCPCCRDLHVGPNLLNAGGHRPAHGHLHRGCTIAFRFVFMVYLLFVEGSFPDHWRRDRDEIHAKADGGDLEDRPSNFPLTKKLWWMVDIAYSVRMVGWIQEPKNGIPPHPPPSRRMFLRATFLKLIMNIVAVDLTTSVFALNPAFDSRGMYMELPHLLRVTEGL